VATWDEIRQQIADAVGTTPDKLPRHDTPDWFSLIGDLQSSHPELAQRARDTLVDAVAPEPLPTQAEITSERRRAGLLAWLSNWAQRRDPTQPHRLRTNRTSVLLVIGLATLAVMLVFRLHPPTSPQPAAHAPQHAASGAQHPTPPTTPASSQTTPGQSSPPTSQGTRSGTGTSTLPNVSEPPLPPGFPRPSSQAQAGSAGATAGGGTQSGQGGTTVITGQPASSNNGVQIVAPPAQTGGLVVVPGTAAAAETGGPPGGTGAGSGLQIVTAQAPQGGPGGAAAGTSPTGQTTGPSFHVGDQFTVKMLTPLAVSPAWQAIPAVAEGIDGPLSGWRVLGSASLGQDGSIQISWTQALAPDGKTTVALHGVAFDPKEGKPGIPHAQTQVMAPQAAKTALSGTLGAISQYVQDQIQAQQVQVLGSVATVSSQVPPFWQVLAQQLSTGFQPAPVQTGGTIVVSRVAAGTPVVVFITAPSP
jgi:hypothetical protein